MSPRAKATLPVALMSPAGFSGHRLPSAQHCELQLLQGLSPNTRMALSAGDGIDHL